MQIKQGQKLRQNNNMLGVFTRFYFEHKKHMVLLPAQGTLEKPARKNNEDHAKTFDNLCFLIFAANLCSQQKYFTCRFPLDTNRLMCMRT